MANVVMKRMLSEKEAQEYLGLKRVKCREFGEKYKAIKHIGSRVLYDRVVLDEALDSGNAFCVKEKTDTDKVLAANAN